jgi:hypothetical protein
MSTYDLPPQRSWGGVREADGGVMLLRRRPMTPPALRATSPATLGRQGYCFGAVDAFCAPQKPNSAPATRRIWISSEPSVMR